MMFLTLNIIFYFYRIIYCTNIDLELSPDIVGPESRLLKFTITEIPENVTAIYI